MPPPMEQTEARKTLSDILKEDKATLVSPIEGELRGRTPISYLCGNCGKEHSKSFSNLKSGEGGGLCFSCAQKRGNERRIASLNSGPKWAINNGETDFNRELAETTATKDGSTLLGIYSKDDNGTYTIIEDNNRITRDSYLYIECQCGEEDYINFRNACGCGAKKPGEGLCLCAACRKGHRSAALRKFHSGDSSTNEIIIESMPKRAERIEKEGQKCFDCKEDKPASDFFAEFNQTENCKVYKSRCKSCHRKLRTSNRNDKILNGSLNDFFETIIKDAKYRNNGYNKKNPDNKREFNITSEYLVSIWEEQKGKCYYSARDLQYNKIKEELPEDKRIHPERVSIDRIDSKKGYIKENVVLCCWVANNIKQDLNIQEFKSWISDINKVIN